MANNDPKPAAKNLKQDALVERLVPDPGNPEPTIRLTGWLGTGTKDGLWRLYLTPQLDEFVQFQEADVVHSHQLSQAESPLGGSTIWLKPGAVVEHKRVLSRQMQADFLTGGVTSGYLGTSDMSYSAARPTKPVPTNSRGYQCSVNPHIPACQPPTEGCGHPTIGIGCGTGPFCGTGDFVCGYSVGCSVGRECSFGCY